MRFSPYHRHVPVNDAASQNEIGITRREAFEKRLLKQRRTLRLILFIVGLFLLTLILPSSPVHQTLVPGYGGGSVSSALAVSHVSRQSAFVNPIDGLTGFASDTLKSTFTSVVSGLANAFIQWVHDSFKSILDTAATFDFITITPHGLTDGHKVVILLEKWMLLVMDGLLSLFLVIGGYNFMFGAYRSFREQAPRVFVAAIAANFCLPILGQFIEANNVLCTGIGTAIASLGIGHLGLDPVGLFDWATAPEYFLIVYLIYLLAAIWLIIQMLLRIALLDLLLVLAPLGLLCFALPQTRMWGQIWAQVFVATFITQFLQLLCIAIGAALIGSFGHSSLSPISLFVGIAALFLAGRIPDMLLFRVLRLNSGTATDFGEQVGGVVQAGAEVVALIAA